MKKWAALLTVLCLLVAGAACAGDTVSDGTPLDLGDFTLELESGMTYELDLNEQVRVSVCPFAADGDNATNYNAGPSSEAFNLPYSLLLQAKDDIKQATRSSLEASGYVLQSFEMSDPYEATLGGAPCVVFDLDMVLTMSSGSGLTVCQRQYYFSGTGWFFSITALDGESRDRVASVLDGALKWK